MIAPAEEKDSFDDYPSIMTEETWIANRAFELRRYVKKCIEKELTVPIYLMEELNKYSK